ncbi:MAG: DUF3592 domain-containing protein [Gammaproteobacteria bacterium]|nr:DUF3592 domain-containing protein [Gammaproteobacteria bacterium]
MEEFLLKLLSITCLIGFVLILWELKQLYSSCKWPETRGKIIQSKIGSPNNSKIEYPYIYYTYEVNGKEYTSRRLANYLTHPTDKEVLEMLLEEYPVGKEVNVKYHPYFHMRATLKSGPVQLPLYYLMLLSLLLISVFTGVLAIFNYNIIFETINVVFNNA